MRTMNHGHNATVVCALLVAAAANASEGCGQRELRDKSTATVMLSPEKVFASGQPLFYLRYTSDVRVLYFRPEDVVAFLEEELAGLRAKYPSVTFSETGIPLDWIRGWIEESYRAVAPKKLVAQMSADAPGKKPRQGRKPMKSRK